MINSDGDTSEGRSISIVLQVDHHTWGTSIT